MKIRYSFILYGSGAGMHIRGKRDIMIQGQAVAVYAVKINSRLEKVKFDQLMACVSPEKSRRIRRFYRFEDAQRSLFGDILIRCFFCKKLELENNELNFGTTEAGKPFLANDAAVHFNLSHSGDWVVAAFHDRPVGIDVEKVKPGVVDFARVFLSETEQRGLMNKPISEQTEYCYEVWTLKESFLKLIGKGLTAPLKAVSIVFLPNQIEVHWEGRKLDYYFHQYHLEDGYKAALCSTVNSFRANLTVLDNDDLYRKAVEMLKTGKISTGQGVLYGV
jgi:4'-phosphopantetheinyl transferase